MQYLKANNREDEVNDAMSSSEYDDLRITLFADIEKAFERVDPIWVLKILAAWGIDSWVYIIRSFHLFFKVENTFLGFMKVE